MVAGSEVFVVAAEESDKSDAGLSDPLPFDGCVPVDVGVDVCATAGTIPATAPTIRAISNFMMRSKLSGRFQRWDRSIIARVAETKMSEQSECTLFKFAKIFASF